MKINYHAKDVQEAVDKLQALCGQQGFDEKFQFELSLCLMEALNNIIEHSHVSALEGVITIICEPFVTLRHHGIRIEVRDTAPDYTPPKPSTESEPMALSGRGWQIMREWLDNIVYSRSNNINCLCLTKMCEY